MIVLFVSVPSFICHNSSQQVLSFLFILGESTLKPNIKDAYFVRDPNSEEEMTVFYKWDHPNFREILGYNVNTFLDGQLISNILLPKVSVNGTQS